MSGVRAWSLLLDFKWTTVGSKESFMSVQDEVDYFLFLILHIDRDFVLLIWFCLAWEIDRTETACDVLSLLFLAS